MEPSEKSPYGLVAAFNNTPAVFHAAEKVRDAGFKLWDVYTPFPVHGLDKAMGIRRSKLPRFTLMGGITGCITGCLMVWFMNAYDYPLIVGGKPFWSPVFPFPIYYELTILFAAFGTFFGMFICNRLPRHHHAIFDHPDFGKAMDDAFLIAIEAQDPLFNSEKTRHFLESVGGHDITLIEQ